MSEQEEKKPRVPRLRHGKVPQSYQTGQAKDRIAKLLKVTDCDVLGRFSLISAWGFAHCPLDGVIEGTAEECARTIRDITRFKGRACIASAFVSEDWLRRIPEGLLITEWRGLFGRDSVETELLRRRVRKHRESEAARKLGVQKPKPSEEQGKPQNGNGYGNGVRNGYGNGPGNGHIATSTSVGGVGDPPPVVGSSGGPAVNFKRKPEDLSPPPPVFGSRSARSAISRGKSGEEEDEKDWHPFNRRRVEARLGAVNAPPGFAAWLAGQNQGPGPFAVLVAYMAFCADAPKFEAKHAPWGVFLSGDVMEQRLPRRRLPDSTAPRPCLECMAEFPPHLLLDEERCWACWRDSEPKTLGADIIDMDDHR